MDAIKDIRIAVASVGPTVLRCSKTEDFIKGKALTEENIKKARAQIESEISPIDDIRSTTAYRRQVTGNLLENFLRQNSQPLPYEFYGLKALS